MTDGWWSVLWQRMARRFATGQGGVWLQAALLYAAGGLFVVAGVSFGTGFLTRQHHPLQQKPSWSAAFASWDGVWYSQIVREGYSCESERASSIVFFPAFPALGRVCAQLTGWSPEVALRVVAELSLLSVCLLWPAYCAGRASLVGESSAPAADVALSSLTILTFWPTSYFFHMTYTESLFLLTLLAPMHAMNRGASPWLVALLAGPATATRSVGVALLAPLAAYAWSHSRQGGRARWSVCCLPLACWGLAAFCLYQYWAFGDPIACIHNQRAWSRRPALPWSEWIPALLALEPIWSVYDPTSPAHWARYDLPPRSPLFSMFFWNPVFYSGVAGLLWYGWRRGWVTSREGLLGAALLAIPYGTTAFSTMMQSHARYAMVAFPAFFTLAELARRLPREARGVALALSAGWLFAWTALFVSWYRVC